MSGGEQRGEYRGIYTALLHSPEFEALPPHARLVLLVLKIKLGPSGIGVVYTEELEALTALDMLRDVTADCAGFLNVPSALEVLTRTPDTDRPWIYRSRSVVWLRNGLRFEPTFRLTNPNHAAAVSKHLRSLPKLPIVNDFARYYGLPEPFPGLQDPTRPAQGFLFPGMDTRSEGADGGKGKDGNGAAPSRTRKRSTTTEASALVVDARALLEAVKRTGLNGQDVADFGKHIGRAKQVLKLRPLAHWLRVVEVMRGYGKWKNPAETFDVFDVANHEAKALAAAGEAPADREEGPEYDRLARFQESEGVE